jgi:hypothetical protein
VNPCYIPLYLSNAVYTCLLQLRPNFKYEQLFDLRNDPGKLKHGACRSYCDIVI